MCQKVVVAYEAPVPNSKLNSLQRLPLNALLFLVTMAVMKKYTFPLFQEASPVNKFNFESCPPYVSQIIVNDVI